MIAAHLIVGRQEEPFLAALLASLDGAVDSVIVNDNSPVSQSSPHEHALSTSAFALRGKLIIDRTPFTNFSHARNVCLQIHRERDAGEWIAFMDADEVHGKLVRAVARNLHRVDEGVDFVDAYTWHFFQSPDWYTSIERRMMFFRYHSEARWEGNVHEQLVGLSGKRIALPYVYGHYGHVLSPRRHAEKGRLYSSLGQSGNVVAEDALDRIEVASYFKDVWPRLLRFTGTHPAAAVPTLKRLRVELAEQFALADRLVRANQPLPVRIRNVFEKLNYEQRWRLRGITPQARQLVASVDAAEP